MKQRKKRKKENEKKIFKNFSFEEVIQFNNGFSCNKINSLIGF